jgi:hypothetical protein
MNETTLRELLRGVAAETPRDTAVDSYLAAETARRQRRLRQRLTVAAAAALVLVVTVATVVSATVLRKDPVPPTTPTHAPTSFDPLRLRVTPGWLPAGYAPQQTRITASDIRINVDSPDHRSGVTIYLAPRDRIVVEQVLAPASIPGVAIPKTVPPGAPGPKINGTASQWYPEGSRMAQNLRWTHRGQLRFHWAPDAIGLVDINNVADPQAVAVRIAEALQVHPGAGTPLPFTLAEKPRGPAFELALQHEDAAIWVRWGTSYAATTAELGIRPRQSDDSPLTPRWSRQVGQWQSEVFNAAPGSDPNAQFSIRAISGDVYADVFATRAEALRIVEGLRMTGKLADPSTWK